MKKNILPLLVIVIACACTKPEHIENNANTTLTNTAQVFQNFNDSLLSLPRTETNSMQTRVFWNFVGKAIVVAGADIKGAASGVKSVGIIAGALGVATGGTGAVAATVAGGVICGAGASILAGHILSSSTSAYSCTTSELIDAYHRVKDEQITYIKLDFPDRFRYINTMGGLHNAIVENIKKPSPSTRSTMVENPAIELDDNSLLKTEDFQAAVNTESAEYQKTEASILQSEEFTQLCDGMMEEVSTVYAGGATNSNLLFDKNSVTLTEEEKCIHDLYMELYNKYPRDMKRKVYTS